MPSCFEQNPFHMYVAQAIGLGLAKLLDLNNIWLLWLGRLCNLIMYATFCGIAIKKTPMLKLPMSVVACFPLSLIQAASISCDSFIISFSFLAFAYLLHMFKSKNLSKKEIAIFTLFILILGLSKVTYAALILLLFFIPKENYENECDYYLSFLSLIIVLGVVLAWTKFYAVDSLLHSWRSVVFAQKNVNATLQLNYILTEPFKASIPFIQIYNQIPNLIDNLSKVFIKYDSFPLFNYIYTMFAVIFILIYPIEEKISRKSKIIIAITLLIIFFGTYFVQYLTWAPVAATNLVEAGVYPRYFLPLCALLPLIFSINNNREIKKLNSVTITIILSSLSSIAMFIVELFY